MKYTNSNPPSVCMMTQSSCYKGSSTMTVRGILWHCTGANNSTLKRYVQPDDNASDRLFTASRMTAIEFEIRPTAALKAARNMFVRIPMTLVRTMTALRWSPLSPALSFAFCRCFCMVTLLSIKCAVWEICLPRRPARGASRSCLTALLSVYS